MNPVIALGCVLATFAIVILSLIAMRFRIFELRHRERMEAFGRGIPIEPDPAPRARVPKETPSLPATGGADARHLLRGLRWTTVGLALTVALCFVPPLVNERPEWSRLDEMRQLSSMHFTHDEMIQSVRDSDRKWEERRARLRGLGALGLIPTAVGIAYLIFYYELQRRRHGIDPPPVRLLRADQ